MNNATFDFHSNEAGSSFQCKLDGGIFEPCSSPKAYTSLTMGDHTFAVRAIDGAGNVDADPATRQFSVVQDLLPTIFSLKPAPGTSIRDRTPLIGATVRDDRTELGQADIKLTLDGRSKSFAYNADTDRLLYQARRLAFGRHTVKVTAVDEKNQVSSRTWTFKVVRR